MVIWYRRLLVLLAAYAIQRLLFVAFNSTALLEVPWSTLLLSGLDGIRFDLCVIATINLPLLAIHLLRFLPINNQKVTWLDNFVSVVFILCNLPLIIGGIIDSRMFTFTGRRISPEMLAIGGDIQSQSIGVLLQYWYITLPSILGSVFFSIYTWQRNHPEPRLDYGKLKSQSLGIFIAITMGFLLIRGGWQTKPLAPTHAYVWQPAALANMVLNSGMTILRTPTSNAVQKYNDFRSTDALMKTLGPQVSDIERLPLAKGKNVVILIIESLATEYVGFLNDGKGYTPFIDDLSRTAVNFPQSYANGRRSIDAMPAIFAGIPAWRDQPFVTSPFASNRIDALPRVLAQIGYQSLFFHGAANGSMHFDVFSKLAGFDQYIGKNEYPDPSDSDGQWGIFDEPFLKFTVQKLSSTKEPFLAGVFTLTSHNPFKIPEKHHGKFPKGTLPIHEAISYADYALGEFFKEAAKESWFNNTIFVITGDHTSLSENPYYNNLPGRFRVPIIFYDPTGALPKLSDSKVASHVDIKPTILELLGVSRSHFGYFGGPLFDPSWTGRFIQQEYDTWYYCDEKIQVSLDAEDSVTFYPVDDVNWQTPVKVIPTSETLHGITVLKAARQYYNNGLLDNSWYPK